MRAMLCKNSLRLNPTTPIHVGAEMVDDFVPYKTGWPMPVTTLSSYHYAEALADHLMGRRASALTQLQRDS